MHATCVRYTHKIFNGFVRVAIWKDRDIDCFTRPCFCFLFWSDFFLIFFLFCPPSVLFLWRMLTAVMMLTHWRDLTGLLNWAHTMGLSGLPPNKKHELCNYATTVSYFAVKHEETPLCELFITRTCSKPSRYESSLQCEITKPSVFGNSLVTLCRWMHTSRN